MRPLYLVAMFFAVSFLSSAQSPTSPRLDGFQSGSISGNVYTNDDFGVIFHFPSDWTADLDPGRSVTFGKDPNGPANKCMRILLRYRAQREVKGWFHSWGILFAIDPACLNAGTFPTSAEQENMNEVNAFAEQIFKLFHPAPFFPPGGVDIFARSPQAETSSVIVYLSGKGNRNIDESDHEQKPVPVSTLFAVTPGPQSWIGWAEMDDDKSKGDMMKHCRIEIKQR